MPATCRACDAPIVWAESATTGKMQPFDFEPISIATVEHRSLRAFSITKGIASVFTVQDMSLHRPGYTSHFATCPDATTHRKPPMTTAPTPTRTASAPTSAPAKPATAPAARPAPAPPPAARSSRLGSLVRGQIASPLRMLVYGPEGVGKTSLLADVPDLILLDVEGGSDAVDVPRYPFHDGPGGHVPRDFAAVLAAIEDLIANPSKEIRAVGIDTIDALEAMLWKHVCKAAGFESIEAFGYGKGYQVALDEWRKLFARLDALRATGVSVLMSGHSFVKPFKNPEGEDYDRYQLRLNEKSAGFVKEWFDVVGFLHFEHGAKEIAGSRDKRKRGWMTNVRVIEFARAAAWDAKKRRAFPDAVYLDAAHPWSTIEAARTQARAGIETMLAEIETELQRIGAETLTTPAGKTTSASAIREMIAGADASVLMRILSGLRAMEIPTDTTTDTATTTNTEGT